MSCCQPSRKAFLEEKLKNFRTFLEPHCGTEELKGRLKEFSEVDSVMPFMLQAVALKAAGQLDGAVAQFCDNFPNGDVAFRTKVGRYFHMFADVLTS
jgi:hypothetical protein